MNNNKGEEKKKAHDEDGALHVACSHRKVKLELPHETSDAFVMRARGTADACSLTDVARRGACLCHVAAFRAVLVYAGASQLVNRDPGANRDPFTRNVTLNVSQ